MRCGPSRVPALLGSAVRSLTLSGAARSASGSGRSSALMYDGAAHDIDNLTPPAAVRRQRRGSDTARGARGAGQIVRNYKQVRTYVPCMRRRFRVSFCLPSIDCIESQCLAQCGRDVVARVRYSRTSTDLRRSPVPRLSLFNACRAPVNASQRARQRGAQPCLLRVPRELPERAAQRSVSPIRAVTWSAATAAGKQRGRRPRGRPWCSCHSSW